MLMELKHIDKTYRDGWINRSRVEVLKDVNLEIEQGETVGIIGPSGSGKTTLANIMCGVIAPTRGEVVFRNEPVKMPYTRELRKEIQIIYQHPEEAFNPQWTLGKSLMEPYRIHKIPWEEKKFYQHFQEFGLYGEHFKRGLHTLSGGELQRAALARIMVLEPKLLILDEPTSMLDSISQAQILTLLKDYQKKHHTAYLLITHNLEVAKNMCHACYRIEESRLRSEESI